MKTTAIASVIIASLVGAMPVAAKGARFPAASDDGANASLLQEHARKAEIAEAVLAARDAASRKMSAKLRGDLKGKLTSVPIDRLEAFANDGGLGDIEALVRGGISQAFGDSAADLVFTPVTPCRIINTTLVGGPLSANTTRNFFVNGSTPAAFETQGGNPGGCGIPDDATAVAMNFVAVAPAGAGDLRAFPFGSATPLASVINYASVPGLNIANGLAQPVCDAATTLCTFDLVVRADVAQSHLVVDVVGYYRRVDRTQTAAVKTSGLATLGVTVLDAPLVSIQTLTVTFPTAGLAVVTPQSSFSGPALQVLNCRLFEGGVQVAQWSWAPPGGNEVYSTTKAVTAGQKTYDVRCFVTPSGTSATVYDREIRVMFFGAGLP